METWPAPDNAPAYLLVDTGDASSLDDSTLSIESPSEDWTQNQTFVITTEALCWVFLEVVVMFMHFWQKQLFNKGGKAGNIMIIVMESDMEISHFQEKAFIQQVFVKTSFPTFIYEYNMEI